MLWTCDQEFLLFFSLQQDQAFQFLLPRRKIRKNVRSQCRIINEHVLACSFYLLQENNILSPFTFHYMQIKDTNYKETESIKKENNNSRVYHDSARNQSRVLTSCNLKWLWRQISLSYHFCSVFLFTLVVALRSRVSSLVICPAVPLIPLQWAATELCRPEKRSFTMLVIGRKGYYNQIQVTKNSLNYQFKVGQYERICCCEM